MDNEQDTPIKMLERFEAIYGTYSNLVGALVSLKPEEASKRKEIENLINMHGKLREKIQMYELGYKHGKKIPEPQV